MRIHNTYHAYTTTTQRSITSAQSQNAQNAFSFLRASSRRTRHNDWLGKSAHKSIDLKSERQQTKTRIEKKKQKKVIVRTP